MYTKYNTILLKVDGSKEGNRMIQTQLSDLSEFVTCLIFIYLFIFQINKIRKNYLPQDTRSKRSGPQQRPLKGKFRVILMALWSAAVQ